MNKVNDAIEAAAKGIRAGVREEAKLRALVQLVIDASTQLQSLVASLPAPSQSRFGFGSLVDMLVTIAQSVWGGK